MVLKKWIQKGIDWLSNLILAAAGLVVLWLFLLVFVYASFRIPTDSMEPTLVPGDYVLVNKLLIGPRLFNLTEALKGKRVNIRRLPGLYDIQRNDVLVFHFPILTRGKRLRCTSSNTMSNAVLPCRETPFPSGTVSTKSTGRKKTWEIGKRNIASDR